MPRRKMVGTQSLSSGAHSRDPLALPTLRTPTFVIARSEATKQSMLFRGKMDCFASLAMTMLRRHHLPRPLCPLHHKSLTALGRHLVAYSPVMTVLAASAHEQ